MLTAAALVTLGMPAAAQAAEAVQFASNVFVERFTPVPGGGMNRTVERADRLKAGDRVIFDVNWKGSRNREFTVTNPMPRSVAFQRSADSSEDVSIDGGRSWGKLADLRVREADGRLRSASPEDVTHLRWRVPTTLAQRGTGQLTYRGVVR